MKRILLNLRYKKAGKIKKILSIRQFIEKSL